MSGSSPAFSTKEHKRLIAGLVAQGGEPRETKHTILLTFPDGLKIGIPKSTSDWRSRLNIRAEVVRAGLEWPLDTNPGRRPLNDAINRVTEALAHIEGPPDVFKIQRWLRAQGKPVGHQDTIKNALRALGWEEVRGRKSGRGYQWLWEKRPDSVPPVEEDKLSQIRWQEPDEEEEPVTPGNAEEVAQATWERSLEGPHDPDEPTALAHTPEHPESLPAQLSADAEWALAEAQRLEARAVAAEHDAEKAWAEVQRLTDLVSTERAHHTELITGATARIDQLLRERDDLRSKITDHDIKATVEKDDSWPAEVDPSIRMGDFIDGAAQYGLEAVIRLRKKTPTRTGERV